MKAHSTDYGQIRGPLGLKGEKGKRLVPKGSIMTTRKSSRYKSKSEATVPTCAYNHMFPQRRSPIPIKHAAETSTAVPPRQQYNNPSTGFGTSPHQTILQARLETPAQAVPPLDVAGYMPPVCLRMHVVRYAPRLLATKASPRVGVGGAHYANGINALRSLTSSGLSVHRSGINSSPRGK
jgi:hypothetical protein